MEGGRGLRARERRASMPRSGTEESEEVRGMGGGTLSWEVRGEGEEEEGDGEGEGEGEGWRGLDGG